EMAITALARRHGIPGNLLEKSLDRFSIAIIETKRIDRYFADFAILQKRHLPRVVQLRRDIRGDKGLAVSPPDDDRCRVFRDDEPLGNSLVQKQQRVRAV